jgi:thiosulfate/3-mercaptopyruvate sulfurtransferase
VIQPPPGAFVDAAWVLENLDGDGVRVVEVDVSAANYNAGHLPGAVLWNAYSDLRDQSYLPVPPPVFADLLSRSGISPATTVVFYGYGSYLGYWLLKAFGHGSVRMLEEGRDGWVDEGREWSTEVPPAAKTGYALQDANREMLADRADVERAIGDAGSVVLDVRSRSEYTGERFWPSGATADTGRAGHVPSAVHLPIDATRDETGSFRPTEDLRKLFSEAGVTPGKRVIVYCTIGNRAAAAWYALTELLEYPDVAVYQGSYVEWGKRPGATVEL